MFVIGQRYMSEMEPELGLGVVIELAPKRVIFRFNEVERTYSTDHPPVKRVIFSEGDEITLLNGDSFEVTDLREEDGVVYYRCGDQEISELMLSARINFTSPVERLLGGLADSNSEYSLRQRVLQWQSKINSSTARGFTGGKIELLPHQLSVAEKICSASKRRFFLADEVGLGKTIEACLTIHRLLLTRRIERVLIVVPSALIHQWFVELYRRFSILATIVNDDFKTRLDESDENLFEYESPVIISDEELAAGGKVTEMIYASSWDMLVVDEAHHLSDESNSYDVISGLSSMIPGLMLLTASPEAMEEKNFFSLLQLVDPIKYSDMEQFKVEQNRYREVAGIADALLSKSISAEQTTRLHELLPQNESIDPMKLTAGEREELVMMLTDICGVGRAIFRNSRSVISGFPKRHAAIVQVEGDCDGVFSKELGQWMDSFLRERESEKILIICKDRGQLTAINKILSKMKSRKITLFHEEMSILQLDRSAAWFADEEGAQVLISTEIGSEGRNFQYADHLILADLPTEPELLEQRIGRLDRIGRTSDVSIFVPVVKKSAQARLADWYDRGLDAFSHTVPGAHRIGKDFIREVIEFSGNSKQWEALIKETQKLRREISERVQKGRNRLLELASCNTRRANTLVDDVHFLEYSGLDEVMSSIFEHFGIFMDDLALDLFHLDFCTVTDHSFPIPMMREEDGMSVTFNRNLALAREDVDFLSIDHPMVLGAFELLTGGEKGNCTVARLPNAGEEGVLVELIYVLAAPGGTALFPERFFPGMTIRLLLDDAGDDVDDLFTEEFLQKSLKEGSLELLKEQDIHLDEIVKPILREQSNSMKKLNKREIKKALTKVKKEFTSEIERIRTLSNDSEEIDLLSSEMNALMENIKEAAPRLEAVRIISLEM